MKGVNAKETMLAAATAVMGFGVLAIQTDLERGALLMAVATVMFFLRGFLK